MQSTLNVENLHQHIIFIIVTPLFFQNKTIPLTKHSSVFNGGIVGMGKRKANTSHSLPPEKVLANINELINVIKACCTTTAEGDKSTATDISLESVTLVSLLLVQYVSPDVMYNGLPWPEEEFSKVGIVIINLFFI